MVPIGDQIIDVGGGLLLFRKRLIAGGDVDYREISPALSFFRLHPPCLRREAGCSSSVSYGCLRALCTNSD